MGAFFIVTGLTRALCSRVFANSVKKIALFAPGLARKSPISNRLKPWNEWCVVGVGVHHLGSANHMTKPGRVNFNIYLVTKQLTR